MGNNLKALRKARGLTQEKLAAKSGVNRTVIARFETGRNTLSTKSLLLISRALEVTTDEILRGGQTDGKTA